MLWNLRVITGEEYGSVAGLTPQTNLNDCFQISLNDYHPNLLGRTPEYRESCS